MIPEYVRVGDKYVVPAHTIKYFYIDTKDNGLTAKLKDGEDLTFKYTGDDAYARCLYNYKYLLDVLGVAYPVWLTTDMIDQMNQTLFSTTEVKESIIGD